MRVWPHFYPTTLLVTFSWSREPSLAGDTHQRQMSTPTHQLWRHLHKYTCLAHTLSCTHPNSWTDVLMGNKIWFYFCAGHRAVGVIRPACQCWNKNHTRNTHRLPQTEHTLTVPSQKDLHNDRDKWDFSETAGGFLLQSWFPSGL